MSRYMIRASTLTLSYIELIGSLQTKPTNTQRSHCSSAQLTKKLMLSSRFSLIRLLINSGFFASIVMRHFFWGQRNIEIIRPLSTLWTQLTLHVLQISLVNQQKIATFGLSTSWRTNLSTCKIKRVRFRACTNGSIIIPHQLLQPSWTTMK